MGYDILECYERDTPLGTMLLVRIHRDDGAAMPWRELWEVFASAYPDRWAVQTFPPHDRVLDQANKYHLWISIHGPLESLAL